VVLSVCSRYCTTRIMGGCTSTNTSTSTANPSHKGAKSEGQHQVLFFPDPALPCRYANKCTRKNCTFSHERTSLVRFIHFLRCTKSSIDICVFTITCNDIANEILALHNRKIKVRIITDTQQSTSTGSDIEKFRRAGIKVKEDHTQHHMHHKFAVIDNKIVMTGSFNWTRSAVLNNKENVVCTDVKPVVVAFRNEFAQLWSQFH
jgi:cardiolipin hydrolase